MLDNWIIVGDGAAALAALLGIAGLVGIGEGLRQKGVSAATTRRLVHVGVALFVTATPLLFRHPLPVYGLAVLFTVVNATARARHWWAGIHAARPQSWGTVALPLSVVPALAVTWSVSPERIPIFQTAYLMLALADPVASWVGERRHPEARARASTWAGSLAFAAVAGAVAALMMGGRGWGWEGLGVGAAVVLVATLAEAVSRHGWDNLSIILAVLLVWVPFQEQVVSGGGLVVSGVLGGVFAGGAYWAQALDGPGAATGGLFAMSLVALGGGPWVGPGLVFFGGASLLSGHGARGGKGVGDRRTQVQVLANGGIAWGALGAVALGLMAPQQGYAVFVGALAAAAADTWATELGRFSTRRPWGLWERARVPTGTSGAVSGRGTLAALGGAGSVVGTALWLQGSFGGAPLAIGAVLLGAGMAGMAADSLAGAFLQARYRLPASGTLVETAPSARATPVRGWAQIDNHAVNLIGTGTGAAVALLGTAGIG
jgi:uncharacterized membrane protein